MTYPDSGNEEHAILVNAGGGPALAAWLNEERRTNLVIS
jgi:hypothetical protein